MVHLKLTTRYHPNPHLVEKNRPGTGKQEVRLKKSDGLEVGDYLIDELRHAARATLKTIPKEKRDLINGVLIMTMAQTEDDSLLSFLFHNTTAKTPQALAEMEAQAFLQAEKYIRRAGLNSAEENSLVLKAFRRVQMEAEEKRTILKS